MEKKQFQLCLFLFLLLIASGCTQNQATHSEQAVPEDAHIQDPRIVSTTVAITEILNELELDLVGIPTSDKPLPERYEAVKEVGFVKKPDLEIIKWLDPTEVYSVSTLEHDLSPIFASADIEATFLNLDSFEEMKQSILKVGKKYGREKQANYLVGTMDKKVEEITSLVEKKEKPIVLILLGIPGSYLVATEHSYIGDLVRLVGGVNVVQGETVEYVASNTEYLQQANPDIILRAAHGMPEEVVEMFDAEFKTNDIWKHFDAVKNGRVYDLEEEVFGTTGNLAIEEALDELMKLLYE